MSWRSGIVGLAGRPNVGKSTLVNALAGAEVAIVSDKPQTTRRALRGIATDEASQTQLVLVDLPGVQRPRDALTGRMQARVEQELADADAVLLVLDGHAGVGPGDRFIARSLAERLGGAAKPVICAVNKCDRTNRAQTAAALSAAAELPAVDEVFPISARRGDVGELQARLAELMPEGPPLFPLDLRTDVPEEVRMAEIVREQVLHRTREEIPHAVEVRTTRISEREDGLLEIEAEIWVESESQKAILIGRGGSMVGAVGTAARKRIERELGRQIYLGLEVGARGPWRADESLLDRLGIE